ETASWQRRLIHPTSDGKLTPAAHDARDQTQAPGIVNARRADRSSAAASGTIGRPRPRARARYASRRSVPAEPRHSTPLMQALRHFARLGQPGHSAPTAWTLGNRSRHFLVDFPSRSLSKSRPAHLLTEQIGGLESQSD